MPKFFVFPAVLAGMMLFTIAFAEWDIMINPWLPRAAQNWNWYNYLFSVHSATILFLKNWLYLFFLCFIVSALMTMLITRKPKSPERRI